MGMKCQSTGLCNKAVEKYTIETGLCPEAHRCEFCGHIMACYEIQKEQESNNGKASCVFCHRRFKITKE